MFRSELAAVLLGAVSLLGVLPASAACVLTPYTLQVKMEGLQPTVATKVQGKEATLLVDSGAFFNAISAKFALEQKLKPATIGETGSHLQFNAQTLVEGVAGNPTVSAIVWADDFTLGDTTFKHIVFTTVNLGRRDGILGQNFLQLADNEYDFAHEVMKVVKPTDCKDANLAYWVASGPYSVLPLKRADGGNPHNEATVLINGKAMTAVFDTGAGTSFITERAAARAGVRVADPGVQESGESFGIDNKKVKTWSGRFDSIKIGDEEIKNGVLDIGRTDADSFDILIGADFFLSHHVYVANSQRKIYFTYNGGRVFGIPHQERVATSGSAQD